MVDMAEAFQTARTAALVIDLQKENFTGGAWPVAGYREVLDNAGKVVAACRRAGVPVIYTRHWLDPSVQRGGRFPTLSRRSGR